MTQLERLKLRLLGENIDTQTELLLQDYLDTAKMDILNTRYPFSKNIDFNTPLDYRYMGLQIELALIKYNQRGVEGQISHSENGVSRTYIQTLLREVTPLVGTLSSE